MKVPPSGPAQLLRYLCLAALVALASSGVSSIAAAEEPAAASTDLPIRRIVLYTSGVGFFERGGTVSGDATIDLTFSVQDINDLLKSLVLEDLDGGQITTVSYMARQPEAQALKTFAIDLTTAPTLATLLEQVRGKALQVEVAATQPGAPVETLEGTLVGIETRRSINERGLPTTTELLTLLSSDGLRSIDLASTRRVQLVDPKLNAELTEALALVAQARSTQKKVVKLHCTGEGERKLRVGYIQETPVWKTSYRLVLRDDEKPLLQGWAIVENTSDHDWKDVELSLVSGRPVSFIMDLYQPLYAVRPTVQPELFSGLRPRRHGQDLLQPNIRGLEEAGRLLPPSGMGIGGPGGMGGGGGFFGGSGPAASETTRMTSERMASTTPSRASADEVGELFRYAIATPVTLERRQSAMLPIVNASVEGQKVSLFNKSVHARHPMSAYHLKNTTSLHLMQGPISLFDGGEYAGDGQIADLASGSKRLVSYALDLDVEITCTPSEPTKQLVAVTLEGRVVKVQEVSRRKTTYTLKNSDGRPRKLLIEQPITEGWKLVDPEKPQEQTRDLYRFSATLEAGATRRVTVIEQQDETRDILLAGLDDSSLETYRAHRAASPQVQQVLTQLVELRRENRTTVEQMAVIHLKLEELTDDQARIRANLQAIDKSNDLYKRYVTKFTKQEDAIEALRAQMAKLVEQQSQVDRKIAEFEPNLLEE